MSNNIISWVSMRKEEPLVWKMYLFLQIYLFAFEKRDNSFPGCLGLHSIDERAGDGMDNERLQRQEDLEKTRHVL